MFRPRMVATVAALGTLRLADEVLAACVIEAADGAAHGVQAHDLGAESIFAHVGRLRRGVALSSELAPTLPAPAGGMRVLR